MATRARQLGVRAIVKNLGFILKEVPFARRRAYFYLNRIIQVGKEVGVRGFVQGRALLNLGILHQLKGKKCQARECLAEAQQIFAQCNSEACSQQVRVALAALD